MRSCKNILEPLVDGRYARLTFPYLDDFCWIYFVIEIAGKIADALDIRIDCLLGKSENMVLDKKTFRDLKI